MSEENIEFIKHLNGAKIEPGGGYFDFLLGKFFG